MADFDLSLLATMDSSSAEAGARAVSGALDDVTAAEQRNDAATERSTKAQNDATAADNKRARALDDVLSAIDPAYASQKRLNDLLEKARALADAGALSTTKLAQVEKLHADAMKGGAVSAGQARAAYSNLGAQVSDITSTLALGINPFVVFGQQAGQTAAALSTMGGTVGKVATFLSGPFGAAILGAITVLGLMGSKMLETEDASNDLTGALDFQKMTTEELTKAINDKIVTDQKAVQVSYAAAEAARAEAKANLDAAKAIREKIKATLDSQVSNATSGRGFGIEGGGAAAAGLNTSNAQLAAQDALIVKLETDLRALDIPLARREAAAASDKAAASTLWYEKAEAELQKRFEIGAVTQAEFQQGLTKLYLARDKDAESIRKAEGASDREAKARDRAAKAADRAAKANERSRVSLEAFGGKAAETIQRITEQFDEQPSMIDKAAQSTRQLDNIIDTLGKRKPPNFQQLIADAQSAKGVIEASLLKPLNEVFEASQRRQMIAELTAADRQDEADALQIIWQLESKLGPLANEYRQQVLDTVIAEREVNEAIDQRLELQNAYLSATKSVRQEVEAILSGTGKLSNIKQIFKNLQGKVLAEQLFGDVFRDLDKYVKDNTSIKSSVDIMSSETERAGRSAGSFADVLNAASTSIKTTMDQASGGTGGSGLGGVQKSFDDALAKSAETTGAEVAQGNEIVVTAIKGGALGLTPERYFDEMFKKLGSPLLEGLDKTFGTEFFSKLSGVFGGAVSGYLTAGPTGGVLGALKGIKGLPESISKGLGDALKGAQTGTMVAGIGKTLGIGMSTTGSQIGGALGSVIPIPGAEILGSIAGGLIGNLFKTSRTAGATITGLDDVLLAGKDSKNYGTASGLAGSVTSSLSKVADELGATIGAFKVTIGTRGDDFRVNTAGGSLKTGSGAVNFGDDEAGAIAYAIADAIADGAIKGISPAVAKALKSNSDIDTALAEAVKVQDLENDIKYMGNSIQEEFDEFAKTAAERVELAKKYGVDLLGVEALNAKERTELVEKAMEAQVGSLQDLVDNLRYGSLYEGSAVDQRQALITEIAKARDAAAAGEDGAADKLATLLEQFNTISKAVYGTTGGFAADRDTILATATDVIAQAQQRINDAANGTSEATAATNAALNENNDQNDKIIEQLNALNLSQSSMNALITALISNNGASAAAALARTS